MTSYDRFEIKFASALIGLLQVWMAAVVVFSNGRDPLTTALRGRDANVEAALVMAGLGLMALAGSALPLRALRHWGLAGTFLASFYLLVISFQDRVLFGMTAGALLVLLSGSFVLLGVDAVKGGEEKARRSC